MTDDKRETKTEDEISNVDLQFMGRSNPEAEIDAAVDAENKAPSDYRREGLDKQDVAMTQTMDASDPPAFGGATGVGVPEDDDRLERIRRRAYELWQESGSPTDREMDFWLQAEAEIDQSAPRGVNGR